ncbi:MAG: TolC family protein [Rouxiella badensis]|uniref:TolC family protein n=1 Tax=Rouxiella badensis TaxID=1646377 RepID=UPI003C3CB7CD
MMKLSLRVCFLSIACLLVGCGTWVKSEFTPPVVHYPPQWQSVESGQALPAIFAWHDFHDPRLERWIARVQKSNPDLALAALRLYQARLAAQETGISQVEKLQLGLTTGTTRALSRSESTAKSSSARLATGYELDLWGKIARQKDATEWEKQASEQDLRAARLSLLATASQYYWQRASLNRRLGIAHQEIEYAEKTLQLANVRFAAGKTAQLDTLDAQRGLLEQQNVLVQLQNERDQVVNLQTLLLGAPPGTVIEEPTPLAYRYLPTVNSGISAAVLQNRPDVKAQELRLRNTLNQKDIKRLDYYPSLSLTATLGTSSALLGKLLSNPMGALGAGLSLPFVEWRKMNLQIETAQNVFEQKSLLFSQTLYQAMREVDDSLSRHETLKAEQQTRQRILALSRQSEYLYEVRYREGAGKLADLLDARQRRRLAELAVEANLLSQYQNLAQIYLALGGES